MAVLAVETAEAVAEAAAPEVAAELAAVASRARDSTIMT